jgi:Leucine-rich repeat (LRR) protein
LSFNNITKIEGLDSLTRITDLSLFNNQIEIIDGLSTLQALNVFSIGNNDVKKIDAMCQELRKFPNLRLLNANGNPIQRDNSEYRAFIIAHVPGLK